MPNSNLNALLRPCVKCGSTERSSAGRCKACQKSRDAARRALNPEKLNEASANWRKNNPEKAKAGVKAWRLENPEKQKAINAAYRKRWPEKISAKSSEWAKKKPERHRANGNAWAKANPEKVRARSAAWDMANPERKKKNSANWTKANPELKRIYRHTRRAREMESEGVLTKGLSKKLFALQRGMCPCCKQPLGDDFHLDHKMPLALGGPNTDDNMQLLRAKCNRQKNKQDPIEFMQQRGFLL